jgi:hypothetical protein
MTHPQQGVALKKLALGLLGAAAVAATVLLVRQQKQVDAAKEPRLVPAGESHPTELSLERIRELGL